MKFDPLAGSQRAHRNSFLWVMKKIVGVSQKGTLVRVVVIHYPTIEGICHPPATSRTLQEPHRGLSHHVHHIIMTTRGKSCDLLDERFGPSCVASHVPIRGLPLC